MEKRTVPGWDEYLMKMVDLVKTKSKDRSTQVGCVIVKDGRIPIVMGYNGFPRGVSDDVDSRHERPVKYFYTEHAERNAIYAAAREGISVLGSTMYVSGLPCADCARAIIQSGVASVVLPNAPFEGKGDWLESCMAGVEMMEEAGIDLVFIDVHKGYTRANPSFLDLSRKNKDISTTSYFKGPRVGVLG